MRHGYPEHQADEWVSFPGGELEGKRPKALCPACRDSLRRAAMRGKPAGAGRRRPLCFLCYRADLEVDRRIKAAGNLDTTSDARFQFQLPFEPLNRPRLEALKATRTESRRARPPYVDQRRRAQIDARQAIARIAAGLKARGLGVTGTPGMEARKEADRAIFQAVHAAELQLPESWIPFVMAR